MDLLPEGITGIGQAQEEVMFKDFKAMAFDFARIVSARVLETKSALSMQYSNFHLATLEIPHHQEQIRILCNIRYPYVTFANPTSEVFSRKSFIDAPELAAQIPSGFCCMPYSLVCQEVTPSIISELRPDELREVRFWKPDCIGGLVFNRWD